ncbi:Acetyltransferase (GNAT) family [Nesidiocoris tenuis]|uniref:Glucosamine 6-phosphate N-acetyltransferase n=1 Tax=Nesidiocoris tenuis TaxID=355587 RepID=A0ABN7B169_9HEMI|nr:Acetyltransferase (GNAT) family [Nesidiocoris tenuis]
MAIFQNDTLYDESILKRLDLKKLESEISLPPGASALAPGPGLVVRPLSIADCTIGYIDVLSQLTDVGNVSEGMFIDTFKKMRACADTYYVTVIEDLNSNQIVGCGTLLVEQKIIHSCALRGRLEDIVVSDEYRGKQLGKLIVLLLTQLAKELNCYKVTLDCKDSNRPFYESLGYKKEESNSNFMVIRYR